jgi:hypothetical protein
VWWKIIAFFYAFCYSVAIFDATFYETAFRIIGFVLFLGGIISLFLFAFNKRFLSERFWKLFMVIYVGYAAVGLLLGDAKTVIVALGIWAYVIAVASSFVFQFPIVLSLWRLSFAPTQSGSRQFGEPAAP